MPTAVYVLAGQSNAAKFARRDDVSNSLAEAGRAGHVTHTAKGASGLSPDTDPGSPDWYPVEDGDLRTGELYRQLCLDTQAAIDQVDGGFVRSVLWVHGEKDAGNFSSAEAYYARMEALIEAFRRDFGEGVTFSILKLADAMPRAQHSKGWTIVQQAQADLAQAYDFVTLLNPDQIIAEAGFAFPDVIEDLGHYDDVGSALLTRAFVAQFPTHEVFGTQAADRITGPDAASFIHAGAGADHIAAGRGGDTLIAGSGDDTARGQAGQDRLFGGEGQDWLRGGDGADRIFGGAGDDTALGGTGADYLEGGRGNDRLRGGQGQDEISGQRGYDHIFGGAGADRIRGQAGEDHLTGYAGDDLIYGGSQADQLFGGSGADRLFGGQGADLLRGGAGDDWLTGGAKADTFCFLPGGGHDVITDFEDGRDIIDLRGFGLSPGSYQRNIAPAIGVTVDGEVLLDFDPLGGAGSVVILGVDRSDLDARDFLI